MKILFAFVLVSAMGLGQLHASEPAASFAEMAVVKSQDQRVTVFLQEGLGKVSISILNEEGRLLHRNSVNANENLVLPYNLSQLPEGNYKVKIRTKNATEPKVVHQFTSRSNEPMELPLIDYKTKVDNRSVKLKVAGIDEPGVRIQIVDQFDRRLFDQVIEDQEGFAKKFKFRNTNLSGLSIRVSDNNGRLRVFDL